MPTISISSPTLITPRSTRPVTTVPAAGNREDVLDRHQEGLVHRTLGLRDVAVDGGHQLGNLVRADVVVAIFQSGQSRPGDDRNVVAREIVFGQKLADFHLDQFQQFFVVDLVDLVQEDDQCGHANLAGQKNVLARLRHRAVGGVHHQDRAVHLGGTGDHVLDVVGVAGAVDVGIVPGVGFVFHVRGRDGDPARLLFRSRVDLVIGLELAKLLRDRRRQRRLAVVNVTNRADVAMRLAERSNFSFAIALFAFTRVNIRGASMALAEEFQASVDGFACIDVGGRRRVDLWRMDFGVVGHADLAFAGGEPLGIFAQPVFDLACGTG